MWVSFSLASNCASNWVSKTAVMGLVLVVTLTGPAYAQVHNDALGFTPTHVFENSVGGDNVDMLSGNLTFAIPIGPRYQVTSGLSYQLSLSYNSKFWDHDCRGVNHVGPLCDGTLGL